MKKENEKDEKVEKRVKEPKTEEVKKEKYTEKEKSGLNVSSSLKT